MKKRKSFMELKETVCLRLSKKLMNEIRELADNREMSANSLISYLVKDYFLKEKAKEKKAA